MGEGGRGVMAGALRKGLMLAVFFCVGMLLPQGMLQSRAKHEGSERHGEGANEQETTDRQTDRRTCSRVHVRAH